MFISLKTLTELVPLTKVAQLNQKERPLGAGSCNSVYKPTQVPSSPQDVYAKHTQTGKGFEN